MEYDKRFDYEVLILIPREMFFEEAYQKHKDMIQASKSSVLHNPNHWDKETRENPHYNWAGGYIWRLTFNYHRLPEGYRYLVEGETIEATDIYWSLTNHWVPAYEQAVGQTWTKEFAIYARKAVA